MVAVIYNVIPMLIVVGGIGVDLILVIFTMPYIKNERQAIAFLFVLVSITVIALGFLTNYLQDIGWIEHIPSSNLTAWVN